MIISVNELTIWIPYIKTHKFKIPHFYSVDDILQVLKDGLNV